MATYVQGVDNGGGPVASFQMTLPGVVAGNLVVVHAGAWWNAETLDLGCSGGGITWTRHYFNQSGDIYIAAWTGTVQTGGNLTITVTPGGTANFYAHGAAAEYDGADFDEPPPVVVGSVNSGGGLTSSTGPINPGASGAHLYCANMTHGGGNGNFPSVAPWIDRIINTIVSSSMPVVLSEDQGNGSKTCTWNVANDVGSGWLARGIAIEESGVAPPVDVEFDADVVLDFDLDATLSENLLLAADVDLSATLAADLTVDSVVEEIAADVAFDATLEAALAVEIPVAADVSIDFDLEADILIQEPLEADVALDFDLDGDILIQRTLGATVDLALDVDAQLDATRELVADLDWIAALEANLLGERPLAADLDWTATMSALVETSGEVEFAADLSWNALIFAQLGADRPIDADLDLAFDLSATLNKDSFRFADLDLALDIDGNIVVDRALEADVDFAATVFGDLLVEAANDVNFASSTSLLFDLDATLLVQRLLSIGVQVDFEMVAPPTVDRLLAGDVDWLAAISVDFTVIPPGLFDPARDITFHVPGSFPIFDLPGQVVVFRV